MGWIEPLAYFLLACNCVFGIWLLFGIIKQDIQEYYDDD